MTGVTYRLRRDDHILELAFPASTRVVLGGIAGLVVVAMILGRAFLGFPIILASLCILGAAYDERWIFDTDAQVAMCRRGVVLGRRSYFLGKTETLRFSDIDTLYVSHFVKGSPPHFPDEKAGEFRRHQVTLYLWMKSGERRTIETRPSDHALDLVEVARDIGAVTGIRVESSY